jgi:hypothetical protein
MGARDIMPFVSGRGGHARILHLPITAATSAETVATSWKEGEVLELVSNTLIVTPDGAADPHTGLVYIAAGSSAGLLQTKTGGTTTSDADGLGAPVYVLDADTEFITRNVVNNNDTNIGPAGSGAMTSVAIGATCDLWRDDTNPGGVSGNVNGDFSFDINGDGMVITQILDSQKRPITESSGTAHWVVAKLLV